MTSYHRPSGPIPLIKMNFSLFKNAEIPMIKKDFIKHQVFDQPTLAQQVVVIMNLNPPNSYRKYTYKEVAVLVSSSTSFVRKLFKKGKRYMEEGEEIQVGRTPRFQ